VLGKSPQLGGVVEFSGPAGVVPGEHRIRGFSDPIGECGGFDSFYEVSPIQVGTTISYHENLLNFLTWQEPEQEEFSIWVRGEEIVLHWFSTPPDEGPVFWRASTYAPASWCSRWVLLGEGFPRGQVNPYGVYREPAWDVGWIFLVDPSFECSHQTFIPLVLR